MKIINQKSAPNKNSRETHIRHEGVRQIEINRIQKHSQSGT
jgi:hypothetical protein